MNFIEFEGYLINFDLVASIRTKENHRKDEYAIDLYGSDNARIEEISFPTHAIMLEKYKHLKDGLITLSLS